MDFAERMQFVLRLEPSFVAELSPTNYAKAKAEFLADPNCRMPAFVYGNSREEHDDELRLLRQSVDIFTKTGFENEAQQQVLQDYVDHTITTIRLLQSIRHYRNDRDSAQERVVQLNNAKLYGQSDETTYRALLGRELLAQRDLCAKDAEMLNELMERYEIVRPEEISLFTPKPETVKAFGELCWDHWHQSLGRVDTAKEYSAEELAELLRTIIREDLAMSQPFQVLVSKDDQALSVSQSRRSIKIPEHRARGPYTADLVQQVVIGHELMTHVMRAVWAERNCPEVAVPLAGYAEFDEGVAKAVEQVLQGVYYPAGAWHYIAIGMAEHDQADFREVFEAQRTLRFLKAVSLQDTEETRAQKLQKAANQAFQCTMRCFRGTSCVPLTKDLIYFNGQQRVWQMIEKYIFEQPEGLWQSLFESGRTDIANVSHRNLLESLGLSRIS